MSLYFVHILRRRVVTVNNVYGKFTPLIIRPLYIRHCGPCFNPGSVYSYAISTLLRYARDVSLQESEETVKTSHNRFDERSRELRAFVASCVQWRDADTRREPGQPSAVAAAAARCRDESHRSSWHQFTLRRRRTTSTVRACALYKIRYEWHAASFSCEC